MKLLIGPEIFWSILYSLSFWVDKLNKPPAKNIQSIIESSYIYIPLLACLLFCLFSLSEIERTGLIVRIWTASLLGGHLVYDKLVRAHGEQTPGIGMIYIAGMIFLFFILLADTVFIKIKYR